jgi:hypothetical protein
MRDERDVADGQRPEAPGGRDPSAAGPPQPSEAQIARIDALTATGRANWFALLAYLAFALVTTLGVEDVDFFVASRQTELPLVGVSIPTFSFFVFTPILGAALYAYLHLHIRKVTEALAEPPPGAPPLEARIRPWLLNDFVLRMRGDGAVAPRPLDRLAWLVTLLLVWLAGPLVLLIMWARTWPAHELWLSALGAACLMAAAYAGALSWAKMRIDLGRAGPRRAHMAGWVVALLCLPVAWLTAANSKGVWEVRIEARPFGDIELSVAERIERWTRDPFRDPGPLDPIGSYLWYAVTGLAELNAADLSGLALAALPPEHADRAAARARYRAEWCARSGLDAGLCGDAESAGSERARGRARAAWCAEADIPAGEACDDHFAGLDAAFEAEWSGYRAAILAQIDKPSLAGRDLRGADLSNASLLGLHLRGADLRGAILLRAQMEEAELSGAQMEGRSFSGRRWRGRTSPRRRWRGRTSPGRRWGGRISPGRGWKGPAGA